MHSSTPRGKLARAKRLRAQGYAVDETGDPAVGADLALRSPPAAIVADLWMPAISGVQLCRLLRSEPATADVPVILCGDRDERRNRFWSERAGAAAYVIKGRTAELVSALARAVASRANDDDDSFFVQLSGGSGDIRDRLARHLDAALFDSVLAAELRSLGNAGSFDRLFDRLAQFMSQVMRYRWIALSIERPERFAIHRHPSCESAERIARDVLHVAPSTLALHIEDEDPTANLEGPDPLCVDIHFDRKAIARFACAPAPGHEEEARLQASIIGRELGGAIRIATLVEESERLATTDGLTGLMNRRAFATAMTNEVARSTRHGYPLSVMMLDIDHFKQINDRRGHASGDRVLTRLGSLLLEHLRKGDIAALRSDRRISHDGPLPTSIGPGCEPSIARDESTQSPSTTSSKKEAFGGSEGSKRRCINVENSSASTIRRAYTRMNAGHAGLSFATKLGRAADRPNARAAHLRTGDT
jgi:two-component system cell cycle response regulator